MAGICIEFLYEETQIEVVVSSPMIGVNSGWGNAKLVLVMERCFRSLGKRVIERGPRKEKREARNKAWDAVMDEQDLQASEGREGDSERIADAYSMTTAETRGKAHLEALKMEEEVRKNTTEDIDLKRIATG